MIPVDVYIIDGEISVNESSFTGESAEVYKYKVDGNITDKNKVFRGTTVYSKRACFKVDKVGVNTMYGEIAEELEEKADDSPLKLRLATLAKTISKIGYISSFVAAFSYLFAVFVIQNNFDINLIKEDIINIPFLFKNYYMCLHYV